MVQLSGFYFKALEIEVSRFAALGFKIREMGLGYATRPDRNTREDTLRLMI